jgi:hypothetical protein
MPATVDSLYEQLFPLTTVMKQRVVETFSGDALDTDRWSTHNGSGTGTFAMADEVDGGFSMKTSGDSASRYNQIRFNGIRQYNAESSGFIVIYKAGVSTNQSISIGLWEDSYFESILSSNNTYYKLGSRNNLIGTTSVDTSIPVDTSWHVHKGETDGTSVTLEIDGTLEGTATYPIPSNAAGDLEPFCQIANAGGSGVKEARLRYFEAYNT